jgi:hypothetical protein
MLDVSLFQAFFILCHSKLTLGYDNMIGPRIKYLVTHNGTPIAALSYNRASLKVGVRDSFIGYDEDGKKIFLEYSNL